jgi:endonuclease III
MLSKYNILQKRDGMKHETLKALVHNLGKSYSETLSIDLLDGRNEEIVKWFLASVLFAAPIRESSAIKTYRCFEKYDILTPERIVKTGWDGLVGILDEGGYTRYDFKTADKLLEVMRNLIGEYGGSLKALHDNASDSKDLEKRLKNLGKGIGDATVNVFLRELRGILEKADPPLSGLVVLAAKNLGITKKTENQVTLEALRDFWRRNKIPGKSFINFETALLRQGKDLCKKERCASCPIKDECSHRRVT